MWPAPTREASSTIADPSCEAASWGSVRSCNSPTVSLEGQAPTPSAGCTSASTTKGARACSRASWLRAEEQRFLLDGENDCLLQDFPQLKQNKSCANKRLCQLREAGFTHRPLIVPFYGLYLESYELIPKRNYLGAYGQSYVNLGAELECGNLRPSSHSKAAWPKL